MIYDATTPPSVTLLFDATRWLDTANLILIDFCKWDCLGEGVFISMAPWCSGLTCHPVTVEIVGSNPIGVASNISKKTFLSQICLVKLLLVL